MLNKNLWKKVVAWLLLLCLMTGLFPKATYVHADDASTPAGYVTVSFEDYGIRVEGDEGDFPEQLGVIIEETQVPFYEGENIAQVTVRLLEDLGITYDYTGSIEDSFYLSNIQGFENETYGYVNSFGEFDSGSGSGWMISLNNWFINMSTSQFEVEDGDRIKWQNTCQLGADIGCDWNNQTAEMTGITFKDNYGELSPAFDPVIEAYTYTIPSSVSEICFEVQQENYWSILTCKVGETSYKPMQAIPVTNGTQIDLYCSFSEYAGNPPTKEDFITITIVKSTEGEEEGLGEEPEPEPPLPVQEGEGLSDLLIFTGAKSTMEATALLGKSNETYTNRVIYDQATTTYEITASDRYIGSSIRFAPVAAETGATVTVYYGEEYGINKELTVVTSVESTYYQAKNFAPVVVGPGKNLFKIVVTPPEGSTSRETTYYFTYYAVPSLTNLVLKSADNEVPYTPDFAVDMLTYSTDIDSTLETVTVTAQPQCDSYQILYNGLESNTVSITDTDQINITVSTPLDDENHLENTYTIQLNKLSAYSVTFDLSCDHGAVVLYSEEGERVPAQTSNVYTGLLPGKTYSYVASAYGYVTKTGTITGPESSGTLAVVLEKATEPTVPLAHYTGDWVNFRGNDENMGITSATVPNDTEKAYMKWAVKYGSGWAAAPTPPIIVDDYLYIAVGKNVLKLDKQTGKQVAISADMQGKVGYALNPITYAEGMLFVPIENGRIQALRADNLEILWVSEQLKGQSLCPITYHNGYVYTGTWNSEVKTGTYYALTVTDEDPNSTTEIKTCSWKLNHTGGFYWAGAYATDQCLVVGSDDGNREGTYVTTAVLYSVDPITGEVLDKIEGIKGDIRSTVSYDAETDRLYFSTKGGWFYSVKINPDGTFVQDSIKFMETGGMSTGTPLVYHGRAYLGVAGVAQFSQSGHSYKVIDVDTMTEIYSIEIPGYVQTSALLSTAYVEDTGKVYIYVTYNYLPGGIFVIEDSEGQTEPKGYQLFTPTGKFNQYCICSLVCDKEGTIYYKNDSCYLMAISNCDFNNRFYYNGGSNGVYENGQEIGFNLEQIGEPLPEATKEGYILEGWYDNESFTGTCYTTIEEELKNIESLYAHWITKAEAVIKKIEAISNPVTIEDKDLIQEARNAYDDLTVEEKQTVTNYSDLQKAEAELEELLRIKVDQVTLNKKKLELTVGGTYQLLATVTPSDALTQNVTWESSNPTVVAVDDIGNVSACKIGTAVITVTTLDQGKTASCTITVKADVVIPPSSDNPVIVPPSNDTPVVVVPPVEEEEEEITLDYVPNLQAKAASTTKITLSWDAVKNANGYEIYQYDKTLGGYQKIDTVTSSQRTYTVKNLDEASVYNFYVKAYHEEEDKTISYGDPSEVVTGNTQLKYTTITKKTTKTNQIALTMEPVEAATGYKIYMSTSKKGTYSYIGYVLSEDDIVYVAENLESNKTYYFKAYAYKNVDGIQILSNASKISKAKTIAVVEIKQVNINKNKATITWSKIENASGYEIYWSNKKNGTYKKAATIKSGKKLSYTMKNIKMKKTYYVKVRSYQNVSDKKIYGEFSKIMAFTRK